MDFHFLEVKKFTVELNVVASVCYIRAKSFGSIIYSFLLIFENKWGGTLQIDYF